MSTEKLFVLVITLVTWGGVFVYLLRLDGVAKKLAQEVKARESEDEWRRSVSGAGSDLSLSETREPPALSS